LFLKAAIVKISILKKDFMAVSLLPIPKTAFPDPIYSETKRIKVEGESVVEPIAEKSFLSFFMETVSAKWAEKFILDACAFSDTILYGITPISWCYSTCFLEKNYSVIADYFYRKLVIANPYRSYNKNSFHYICSNLANFCGIEGSLKGYSLIGGHRHLVCLELLFQVRKLDLSFETKENLISAIKTSQKTEKFFKSQPFKKAFLNAKRLGVLNRKSIDRIRAGDPVIIPVGYLATDDMSLGHVVDVVFCGNQFAICNRGSKYDHRESVLIYQYKIDKLNIHVIRYLLFNYLGYVPKFSITGPLHQEIYLYQGLVSILDAVPISFPLALKAKNQKVSNCPKATPLISFRVALFYILHKGGIEEELAALAARQQSKTLSLFMRKTAIQRVKEVLRFLPEPDKKGLGEMLIVAQGKLDKVRSLSYPKS
jgi:hypothetical protein